MCYKFILLLTRITRLLFLLFFLIGPVGAFGQIDSIQKKKKLSMKDPEDGAFDLSEFLLEANGVLPIIIPITEPAVGYGGALALMYFHKRKEEYKSYVPPSVSGVVGL